MDIIVAKKLKLKSINNNSVEGLCEFILVDTVIGSNVGSRDKFI